MFQHLHGNGVNLPLLFPLILATPYCRLQDKNYSTFNHGPIQVIKTIIRFLIYIYTSTLLIKEQTRIILHPPNLCVHKTISTVRSFSHRHYNRTDSWLRFRSNCSAGQTMLIQTKIAPCTPLTDPIYSLINSHANFSPLNYAVVALLPSVIFFKASTRALPYCPSCCPPVPRCPRGRPGRLHRHDSGDAPSPHSRTAAS
jgi:hypothetical protein